MVQVKLGHLRKPKKLRELLKLGRSASRVDLHTGRGVESERDLGDQASTTVLERPCVGTFIWPCGIDQRLCAARPGFLDLFSGARGVARELARLSGRWVLCYDIKKCAAQDLSSSEVQTEVLAWLRSGWVVGLGASPASGSFSAARKPSLRSARWPQGLPGLSSASAQRVTDENKLAAFVGTVISECVSAQIPFWIENPRSSYLWQLDSFAQLAKSPKVGSWCVDYCAYGTPWRRPTQVLTSTVLRGQSTLCPGCDRHVQLRGRSRIHRLSMTKLAEPFPRGLSLVLAMSLSAASGDRPEFRKLDATQWARCLNARIGEASNPGPASRNAAVRARERAGQALNSVPLVEPKTEAFEVRLWAEFEKWVFVDCAEDAGRTLLGCSGTAAPLLGEYGDHLFRAGAPLSTYRHLLAYAQRRPLPRSLCHAMASVAFAWGWPRFGLVLLICFAGMMRIGEVLQATRLDLVLPVDLLSEDESRLYVRIRAPKTRRRGGGRQQHATVSDEPLVRACTAVFGRLKPAELLYPLSPQAFRRRWDDLLSALRVSPEVGLTPACVRGGAAVEAYRRGHWVRSAFRLPRNGPLTTGGVLPSLSADFIESGSLLLSELPFEVKFQVGLAAPSLLSFLSKSSLVQTELCRLCGAPKYQRAVQLKGAQPGRH
ncbi:Kidins220 [Symbiodinium sp. CCMP2592]|nr:Kidins220 [Symbiodinium sp. CCMP2592]